MAKKFIITLASLVGILLLVAGVLWFIQAHSAPVSNDNLSNLRQGSDAQRQRTLERSTRANDMAISTDHLASGSGTNPAPDVIDRVVQYAEWWQSNAMANDFGRLFPGLAGMLPMPSNAPLAELARAAFKSDDWPNYRSRPPDAYAATNVTVVTNRRVHICGVPQFEDVLDPYYTAALLHTAFGPRVVLLQFQHGMWWHMTYDPARLPETQHPSEAQE